MIKNPTVGTEVVVFHCGSPINHAGRKAAHPCRGTITKVGRKLVHVTSLGSDLKIPLDGSGLFDIHTVEAAKVLYRATFDRPGQYRTPAQIDRYVSEL